MDGSTQGGCMDGSTRGTGMDASTRRAVMDGSTLGAGLHGFESWGNAELIRIGLGLGGHFLDVSVPHMDSFRSERMMIIR